MGLYSLEWQFMQKEAELRMASLGVPNALAASSSVGEVECEFLVQPEMSVADLVRRRIRPFLIMLRGWWW